MLPRPLHAFKSRGLKAQQVAAGAYHSAAIIGISKQHASQLFTWGEGEAGRLGHGDQRTRHTPLEVHYRRMQHGILTPTLFLPPTPEPSPGALSPDAASPPPRPE